MMESSRPSAALEEKLSSLLSSPNFSVAAYLDLALENGSASPAKDEELQRRMAELALQLQMQTQACHEDIGRIGAELQAILPRCAADVGRVGVGLEGMRIDAQQLLEESALLSNDEVSSSLETLSTLHALRSNLGHTKDILKAAATWDTTLNSIPPLLAQQNLTEAVAALSQLESGERALRGMAGIAERQEAIAKTRQQVQVLLTPQLKHALQNMHTRLAPLQHCVSLYSALDKMDVLQKEYIQNRPGSVHKAWFSYSPTTAATAGSGAGTGESFVAWLPGWYDGVLTLLTEERRQSLAVFGPDLAPRITAKILGECFRPILSSFSSRLEQLYSSKGTSSSGSGGSLESICAVYEATLQFLSLTYETVAGGWLDVADAAAAASTSTTTAASVYRDICTVFLQVATPFRPYQEKMPTLELRHSSIAQQLIAKDIQQAVVVMTTATTSNNSNLISSLGDATEKLKALAPFIFPLAESAMGRLELMTGGYKIAQSLATIDSTLAKHAGELAMATQSLSAAMTGASDHGAAKQLAENFDDQHVSASLDVLKVAGTYQRALLEFEGNCKERMMVLKERMVAYNAQHKKLDESSHSSKAFAMPESLSIVEIDSLLTKDVLGDDHDEEGSVTALQRLASKDAGAGMATLFADAKDAVARLTKSCHVFIFDVCSVVPRQHLSNAMSTMSCWTEDATGADDGFDSYGTLPQNYITHVGEHMLALVQALEPFASDKESLALANEVMGGVKSVALQSWRDFAVAAEAPESSAELLMAAQELTEHIDSIFEHDEGLEDQDSEEEEEEEEPDEDAKASAAFCNQWLDVVGLAVTGRLLERIMRISKLSIKGCDHLSADLNYFVNVLSALGVAGHPHPLVSHVSTLAMMDGTTFQEVMDVRKQALAERRVPVLVALRAVEARLALIRGIPVN